MNEGNITTAVDKLTYQKATTVRSVQAGVRTDQKEPEQRTVMIRNTARTIVIRYAPHDGQPTPLDTSAT